MQASELKPFLQQPYDRAAWVPMLRQMLGTNRTEFFSQPQAVPNPAPDRVTAVRQLGYADVGEANLFGVNERLAILEVELHPTTTQINKNRVGLRALTYPFIDDVNTHGLLVFYHDPAQLDYRFSLQTRSVAGTSATSTATSQERRRYTYVLGPQEAATTASQRLSKLVENREHHTLANLQDAFSVEKLNKEFFNQYKAHYDKFWKYLAEHQREAFLPGLPIPEKPLEREKQEKPIRDFVKKLLGRLVFLHFLQRKGWLGCSAEGAHWKDGNQSFLLDLFEQCPDKTHFHSQVLRELFFNTLNNPNRVNYRFQTAGMAHACRVPYLNGGLFDNDDPQTAAIDFPESFFNSLLHFFAQYNFTIDENRPDDHEVGIDPEMLGHIFENLLEENREKGAFYTPREIVQYMCQEALIEHLSRKLQPQGIMRPDVAELVQHRNVTPLLRQQAKYADDLLHSITVCDPAIGSGAFPMGMLQEIFSARRYLFPHLPPGRTFDPVQVKKHIIQHTIHGVDLERGAVDIARLRFWLALVVDEEQPHPLPNLDFKIMQGNSLLESFEGIPLHHIKPLQAHLIEPRTLVDGGQQLGMFQTSVMQQTRLDLEQQATQQQHQDALEELLNSYFEVGDAPRKAILRKQIETQVHEHLAYNVDFRLAQAQRLLNESQAALDAIRLDPKDTAAKRQQKEKARNKQQKAVDTHQQAVTRLEGTTKRLDTLQDGAERPYFLWHLYFRDVFEKGGFDIMIGNPPYIQLQKMGGDSDLLQQVGYETFTRTGDIYALFYEKGYQMLKPGGCLAYITSNKWLRANYGEKLRTFFVDKTNPLTLLDFNDYQLFDNAVLLANIMVLTKEANKRQTAVCKINRDFKQLRSLRPYLENRTVMEEGFSSSSWVVMDSTHINIKRKVEQQGIRLKDWNIKINYGIKTGLNPAFVVDGQKKDALIAEDPKSAEIIRPLLRGRDIDPYQIQFADQWLIFTRKGINISRYPAIEAHLRPFYQQLRPRNNGEDTGRKPGPYEWYEIQDNVAYYRDFEKPKIVYPNMTSVLPFVYDKGAFYTNQKCFIITGERLGYLTALFNSKLFRYCFKSNFPELPGVTRELSKVFFDQIPIKQVSDEQELYYLERVEYIQKAKAVGVDTKSVEDEIEAQLADDYELSSNEKAAVFTSTD